MFKEIIKIAGEQSNEVCKSQQTHVSRAAYVSLSESNNLPRQIQIFTKTGSANNYSRFVRVVKPKPQAETKNKKIIAKKRKNSSDDQYNIKNQKKDRNVISNLIHHLIKYLNTTEMLETQVKGIIQAHNLQITFQEFHNILGVESRNLKTYVTIKHIKDLWFNESPQKNQFCQIIRILSRSFYSKNGFLSIFYSNKFNYISKNIHYKGVRNLLEVLIYKDIDQLRLLSN